VTQRQGEVQVVVRTADANLQNSLRQNLPELVNALDRSGFHAETFVPRTAVSAVSPMTIAEPDSGNPSQSNLNNGTSHPNSGGGAFSQGGSSGNSGGSMGGRDGRQHQQTRDRLEQSWSDQMER
jgi:hypothetical protein